MTDTRRLPADFAGRPLTGELLAEMAKLGADPCGENGEYHSFVPEGPLFARPIPVTVGPAQLADGYAVAPLALQKA